MNRHVSFVSMVCLFLFSGCSQKDTAESTGIDQIKTPVKSVSTQEERQDVTKSVNYEKVSFQILRAHAKKGNTNAQQELAKRHSAILSHSGITVDQAKFLETYRKAANENDADSQCFIGYAYSQFSEDSLEGSAAESLEWYLKAARQNQSDALYMLGQHYTSEEDYVEAIKWHRKAAEQNYPGSLRGLGLHYLTGLGVEQDVVRGHAYLETAANLGDEVASYCIVTTKELERGHQTEAHQEWKPFESEELRKLERQWDIEDQIQDEFAERDYRAATDID